MFGIFKRPRSIVEAHWYVLMLDFETSADGFYQSIESEINGHRFPGVDISREILKEGGVLSSGREYLRIRREQLHCDVGCGPFGDCWYFSCRGCLRPRRMFLWEILVAVATIASFAGLYILSFGTALGLAILAGTMIAVGALLMHAGKWIGLDDFLLNLPVVGGLYEIFFRRETYHRQDTRLAFLNFVNHFVRLKVEEDALARGRNDVHFLEPTDIQQPMGFRDLVMDAAQQLAASARQ